MNNQNAQNKGQDKSQRGAALITVLMMSTLLLATGGVLVLVTGLSNRTAIDATAEMQAYYSAEAGMQDTLNVLRGNVNPQPGMPANSKIDFRKAVTASDSNRPGDNSGLLRLSGWFNYSYAGAAAADDRVPMTENYSPLNGLAYSVLVSDPDSTPPPAEPSRLLIRVRGFGPKGAEKRLELIVKRTSFEYNPQCVICSVSSENGIPMIFSAGDSNAKDYSGEDRAGGGQLSVFGTTSPVDTAIQIADADKNTFSDPVSITINQSSLPSWAQSANEARAFVADQKANAINQGRYFSSFSGQAGTEANPAFTFVEGDCNLDGGAGLLIVTGKLLMKGNPSFKGLILVLGEGYVERDGGGEGNIYGAMFIARFNQNGGPFLAPTFMTNGGGNSDVQNDSSATDNAKDLSGPRVMGVHEH